LGNALHKVPDVHFLGLCSVTTSHARVSPLVAPGADCGHPWAPRVAPAHGLVHKKGGPM
jgi:hypothetical protein